MKRFKINGPINPQEHYYVAHRINEAEIQPFVDQEKYFILHAPGQNGIFTVK